MTTTKTKPTAQNGKPEAHPLAEAIKHEEEIRELAEMIWAEADEVNVTPNLLRELRSLLRAPIPTGFIEHVGEVPGKPYASTGVRSVQVQMDRLDNVLGAHNWGYRATYSDDGKRCYVKAWVGTEDSPVFWRDSWGGVKSGSTEGNVFKGSFTNAAKPAFARLGPAWEVYVGAADFDPDTDASAAKAQDGPAENSPERPLKPKKAEALSKIIGEAGLSEHLPNKLRSFGKKELTDLTVEQGLELYEWAQGGKDG